MLKLDNRMEPIVNTKIKEIINLSLINMRISEMHQIPITYPK